MSNVEKLSIVERGFLVFEPSQLLGEMLKAFADESKHSSIGRRGLFLYSNHTDAIHRRGADQPESIGTELAQDKEFYKGVRLYGDRQMRLARKIKFLKSRKSAALQINLHVIPSAPLAPYVETTSFVDEYGSIPVHTTYLESDLASNLTDARDDLVELVLGRRAMHPALFSPSSSPNPDAHTEKVTYQHRNIRMQ